MARITYIINGFERGGAELGLLHMIRGGVFKDCDFTLVALVSGDRAVMDAFRTERVKLIVLSEKTSMSISQWAASLPQLVRVLRAENPDATVLSLPQANIVGRIASCIAGVPHTISFEHNTRLARSSYELLYRLTSPFVKEVWADCGETLNVAIKRLYLSAPALRRTVPLVSLEAQQVAKRDDDVEAPFRLVSVGRLTKVKNHQTAIKAVAELRTGGLDARLDIYGEGALREELQSLASELGVADLIAFKGFQAQWWNAAPYDAFVLSSLHEGLCIVALEAMAANIPVVGPLLGGLRDYGRHGAIMEIGSPVAPSELAQALRHLRRNADACAVLREKGQRAALERFGRPAVETQYQQLNQALRGYARRRVRSLGSCTSSPEYL